MRRRKYESGQATVELLGLLPLLVLLALACLQVAVAGQAWWMARAAAQHAARAAAIGADPRSAAFSRLPSGARSGATVTSEPGGVVVKLRVPRVLGADVGSLSATAQMRSQR
jgi:pilus assembly protein CpaE